MNNFSLYDLSALANAIEHERKLAQSDYAQRMNHLDRISLKLRQQIDQLTADRANELEERGFFETPYDILHQPEEEMPHE